MFSRLILNDSSKTLLVKCWSDVGHHVGHAKKKGQDLHPDLVLRGGDDGIRTHDPHVANVMLSQLSYIPTCMCAAAQDGIFGCTLPFVKKALNNSHVNRKSGSHVTLQSNRNGNRKLAD